MSRRTLALVAVSAVVAGVAIFVIAGRGGSAGRSAVAGPSPAANKAERGSVATPGPRLEVSAGPAVASGSATDEAVAPRAHVAPEVAARALEIAGSRATAPTGTAKVRTNPAIYDKDAIEAQRAQAMELLAKDSQNVDAKRVVVSAACASNDLKTARKYAASLPPGDRADMVRTCRELGANLVVDNHWDQGKPAGVPEPVKPRPPK